MSNKVLATHVDADLERPALQNLPAVVLLSPRLVDRPKFLAELLGEGRYLYYSLPGPVSNLDDFLLGLVQNLRSVEDGFSEQTLRLLSGSGKRRPDLATALAQDLAQAGVDCLVLDQVDYLTADEATRDFVEQLAQKLSGQRVICLGRWLDHRLWLPLVQQGQAVVLGDAGFAAGSLDKPHLDIYALSGGEVLLNGLPIREWGGPLAHHLFLYLLSHPLVTRDEIFQTFWPRLSTKEATNVYHVTKRKIAELIGGELTTNKGGLYRLSANRSLYNQPLTFGSLAVHAM